MGNIKQVIKKEATKLLKEGKVLGIGNFSVENLHHLDLALGYTDEAYFYKLFKHHINPIHIITKK